MPKAWLGGAAVLALFAAGPVSAQAPRPANPAADAREGAWTTDIYLLSSTRQPAERPRPDAAGGYVLPAGPRTPVGWITADDLPAAFRRRAFSTATVIEIEIDAAGRNTACNVLMAGSEPELAQLACRLAVARVRSDPYYTAPGVPIATRRQISIAWETSRAGGDTPSRTPQRAWTPGPPAPPARPAQARPASAVPPRPRVDWPGHVTVASLPQIQSMFPAGARRRQGRVTLDLLFSARHGITGCSVVASSGDAALDDSACRAARTLELRYLRPCEYCLDAPLPLQVIWNRAGGSHIRLPLWPYSTFNDRPAFPRDPADTRTARQLEWAGNPQRFAFTTADFARIANRTMRRKLTIAEVAVSAEGRGTLCRMLSTGNSAIDVRACRLIMARRYPVRTDVFGDPAPHLREVSVDLRAVE